MSEHSTTNDNNVRILIISQRDRADGFGRQPGYTAFLESEDTLAENADTDMVMIETTLANPRVRARRVAGRQLRRWAHSDHSLPAILPGRATIETPREHYDVGVFLGFTIWDLPLLERMPEIRERCDRLVGWFPETWGSDVAQEQTRYEAYGILDAVFVGMDVGARKLADITNTPIHHLPPAVDAIRFSPNGRNQPRPIDVLGIGRRNPQLHEHLLNWSHKSNKLYVYDTITGAKVLDLAAHRTNLGDTYARTNVAMTNYAKSDLPEVTQGEREIPGRLWEALASGAHMIGLAPDAKLQERVVGRTVVVEIPDDPAEAVELIDDLSKQDLESARLANSQLALRRHDWAHRWQHMFRAADIEVPRGIETRIENMSAMADALDAN